MARQNHHSIKLSSREIEAIVIGLQEYLYLAEEGNMRDIASEQDYEILEPPLHTHEVAELISKLQGN